MAPTFDDVPFKANTGFLSLAAGNVRRHRHAGRDHERRHRTGHDHRRNGGVYTAIARDAAGGGAPLGLILLDDFLQ